ncbi:MAG: alpha/beta fold hydrolase [Micrococcaceae bacterium]
MKKKLIASFVAIASILATSGCYNRALPVKNDQYFTGEVGKWTKCPIADQQQRECEYVSVPLYKDSKENIKIAVAKVPARKANEKKGTLVVVPGGPNTSGLSMTAGMTSFLPAEILDHYDIVSYDRRGVGRSGEMKCDDQPSSIDQLDQFANVGEVQNYQGMTSDITNYIEKCAAKTDQIYAQGGSKMEAQDLEYIRQNLATDKISILAYSYGTLMAQSYLNLYGAHTDKVVLDSPFDSNISGAQYAAKNDPALGFPSKFNDGAVEPKLTDAQTEAATGLKESDQGLPVSQAYVCKDFKWSSELSQEAKDLNAQNPTQPGLAMDPFKAYAVCSALQSPAYVVGNAQPAAGSAKPLIIASTQDQRATLDQAKAVASRTHGQLYEVPGNRHMITGFGRPCAAETVENFFVNSTFDASKKCSS